MGAEDQRTFWSLGGDHAESQNQEKIWKTLLRESAMAMTSNKKYPQHIPKPLTLIHRSQDGINDPIVNHWTTRHKHETFHDSANGYSSSCFHYGYKKLKNNKSFPGWCWIRNDSPYVSVCIDCAFIWHIWL